MTEHYPRACRTCGQTIHMLKGNDGRWRAFDYPDNTESGDWEIHNKGGSC